MTVRRDRCGVMATATYFGLPVIGVLNYTHSTADIVVEIPECAGPERITNVPLTDIDVWPDFTDHSRPGCCRDVSAQGSPSHGPAQSDPVPAVSPTAEGLPGRTPNLKEDNR